jgi:hypothetical protein
MRSFLFHSFGEILEFVQGIHPKLEEFRRKIDIRFGGATKTGYVNESDSFAVVIQNGSNFRHKAMVWYMSWAMWKDFRKAADPFAQGAYSREREGHRIEVQLLRHHKSLLRTKDGDLLLQFARILFEFALYANPEQDLSNSYAGVFNRCFWKAKQKANNLYLLDKDRVERPLFSLPYVVAYFNIIWAPNYDKVGAAMKSLMIKPGNRLMFVKPPKSTPYLWVRGPAKGQHGCKNGGLTNLPSSILL